MTMNRNENKQKVMSQLKEEQKQSKKGTLGYNVIKEVMKQVDLSTSSYEGSEKIDETLLSLHIFKTEMVLKGLEKAKKQLYGGDEE